MVMRHFRRSRPRMMAPIISYKHQFQEKLTYAGGNANNQTVLYFGGLPGAQANPSSVPAGNKVYNVDVSVNFVSSSGGESGTYSWFLTKMRDGQLVDIIFGTPNGADWSNLGLSPSRNAVIKSYTGLVGTEDAGPLKQNVHIKIPKIYTRVREGDQLIVVFNADLAGTLNIGIRYKSFS